MVVIISAGSVGTGIIAILLYGGNEQLYGLWCVKIAGVVGEDAPLPLYDRNLTQIPQHQSLHDAIVSCKLSDLFSAAH